MMDELDVSTWWIDYDALQDEASGSSLPFDEALPRSLSAAWLRTYRRSVPHPPRACEICVDGFRYIFDDPASATAFGGGGAGELVCERLVAVHGRSQPSDGAPRKASRIRGFPRGTASDAAVIGLGGYDRGHFMAHASGGGPDINLFTQLAEVNRGLSERGRIYRRMEKQVGAHPGTYCFSRPIYTGWTDHPYEIEFGILTDDGRLWVERFPNCRGVAEMRAIEAATTQRMREGGPYPT